MGMSSKSFLRFVALLAVASAAVNAFPKPGNKPDILGALLEHQLCSPESLAKMSPICRIICQTVCGMLKSAEKALNTSNPQRPPQQQPRPWKDGWSYNPVPVYQSPLYYPRPHDDDSSASSASSSSSEQDSSSSSEEKPAAAAYQAPSLNNEMIRAGLARTFPDHDDHESHEHHEHHDHRDESDHSDSHEGEMADFRGKKFSGGWRK